MLKRSLGASGWDLTNLAIKTYNIKSYTENLIPGNFYSVEFSSLKSEDIHKLELNFTIGTFCWESINPIMFIGSCSYYYKILFKQTILSIDKTNYCKFVQL